MYIPHLSCIKYHHDCIISTSTSSNQPSLWNLDAKTILSFYLERIKYIKYKDFSWTIHIHYYIFFITNKVVMNVIVNECYCTFFFICKYNYVLIFLRWQAIIIVLSHHCHFQVLNVRCLLLIHFLYLEMMICCSTWSVICLDHYGIMQVTWYLINKVRER